MRTSSLRMLAWLITAILLTGGSLSGENPQNSGQKSKADELSSGQVVDILKRIQQLNEEARRLQDAGDDERASAKLKQMLAVAETLPESEEQFKANTRAMVRLFEKALEAKKTLAKKEGTSGPAHAGQQQDIESAEALFSRGVAAFQAGEMPAALRAWSDALRIYMTISGTKEQQATCHKNIGSALHGMGRYAEATQHQEQALASFRTVKGAESEQASCTQNIGLALDAMGKHAEAIPRLEQALAMYKTIMETERQQADCCQSIGLALLHSGTYGNSIQRMEQAIALYKAITGTEREQAYCYGRFGVALLAIGKYAETIRCQDEALIIFKTINGTEREQAACHQNAGVALLNTGQYAEAIRRQQDALAIYKTITGSERQQAECSMNIGLALEKMGKHEEAIQRLQQALAIYKTLMGTEREQTACQSAIEETRKKIGERNDETGFQEPPLTDSRTNQATPRMKVVQDGAQLTPVQKLEMLEKLHHLSDESHRLEAAGDDERASDKLKEMLAILEKLPNSEELQADCRDLIKIREEASKEKKSLVYGTTSRPSQAGQPAPILEPSKKSRIEQLLKEIDQLQAAGDYERALDKHKELLAIIETIPNSEKQQVAFRNSIRSLEEVIEMRKKLKAMVAPSATAEPGHQAQTFESVQTIKIEQLLKDINSLHAAGDYERALDKHKELLAIIKKLPNSEKLQADERDMIRMLEAAIEEKKKSGVDVALSNPALAGQQQSLEKANALYHSGLEAASLEHDMPGAIEALSGALRTYQTIKGTELQQADCHKSIGGALGIMGKSEEDIARQKQALNLYEPIRGTEQDQADCRVNIGASLQKMRRFEEAIAQQEQALRLYRAIEDTELIQLKRAVCHQNIGTVLREMGKYEEAIARQEQALHIYQTIEGSEVHQAGCHMNIANALDGLNKYEEAIAQQELALRILQTIKGGERYQAACQLNIGVALREMGKSEEGIRRIEQALLIFQPLKGTEGAQAGCHMMIGNVLADMGKYGEGLKSMDRALYLYKTTPSTEDMQAGCDMAMGVVLGEMGKSEEGIRRIEQALRVIETIRGAEGGQASCLADIGDIWQRVGQFAKAIEAYEAAHERGRNWWTCRGLGNAYRRRKNPGDLQLAADQFCAAAQLAEGKRQFVSATENRTGIFEQPAQVFVDFTALLVDLAQNHAAITRSEIIRWVTDAKAATAPLEAAFHYADCGKARSLEDALREKSALQAARPDTKLLAEDRALSLRISKLTSLREALPEGELERRKKLTQDIEELQQRRNMIEVELKKMALGGYVAPDFRKPMEIAKELEPDRAVLQYSVGEKEGWLLILTRDGVTAHKLGTDTPALPELLPRQEATLGQLAEAWQKRPDKIGVDGLVRLARARAEDLSHPEAPIPATARDDFVTRAEKSPCQTTPRHNLVDATAEQAILERVGEVVMPDSALAELRQKGIRRLLVIPDGSLHYIPFAMLRLKNEKGSGTHYLVEEFASSDVPSMTTLDTIRKQTKEREAKRKVGRRELLAFANPTYGSETAPTLPPTMSKDDMITRLRSFRADYYKSGGLCLMTSLPETEQEAVRVASLFAPPVTFTNLLTDLPDARAAIFIGKGAAEEQVKRLLAPPLTANQSPVTSYRYVLFSTHGLADPHNGMLSCLALSSPTPNSEEDGFLQAQEVMNLELDADLVMLSACQTGLGRLRGGEGLVGLSAAFFYAGAESVCATLWQVPSGPTSQLVPEFFRNLKSGKTDRSEALRQAQLTVMRQGKTPDGKPADYSSPFCWAAFVLMGEYR